MYFLSFSVKILPFFSHFPFIFFFFLLVFLLRLLGKQIKTLQVVGERGGVNSEHGRVRMWGEEGEEVGIREVHAQHVTTMTSLPA